MLFDTVLNKFIQDSIWIGNEDALKNNIKMFELYDKYICACYVETFAKSVTIDQKTISTCIQKSMTDTGYLSSLKKLAGRKTMDEIYSISQLALYYSLQKCKSVRDYFLPMIKELAHQQFWYGLDDYWMNADKRIISYHSKADTKNLSRLFPESAKSKQHILALSKIFNNDYLIERSRDKNDAYTINKIFYKFSNSSPILLGKITYSFTSGLPDATVKQFVFLSLDKIPNKAEYLSKMKDELIELAPPIQESLKNN